MPAASTDKLKKLSRRWVGQIGAAGVSDDTTATIPLASTTNLPTDTAVVAVIDRVDANGASTPTLEETVIGVVSGSNLATSTRGAEGTAQAHSAGAVVEILVTAKGWNDMVDWGLVEHNQDGTHKAAAVTTLKATGAVVNTGTSDVTIVTPKAIADSAVLTANGAKIYAADAGSNDTYVITLAPVPAAYVTGMVINFKANTANTGAATLNVNSLGAITIKKAHDQDLATNDIESGQIVTVVYDGTNFQMQSQLAQSSGSTAMQGAKVYLTTDQNNIGTSATKIAFDHEVYDTAGNFASSKYTVPSGKAGYYLVQMSAYLFSAITDGGQHKAMLYRNGAMVHEKDVVAGATNVGISVDCMTVIHLDATDYVEFYVQSSNAGTDVYSNSDSATHTWALVQQLTQD